MSTIESKGRNWFKKMLLRKWPFYKKIPPKNPLCIREPRSPIQRSDSPQERTACYSEKNTAAHREVVPAPHTMRALRAHLHACTICMYVHVYRTHAHTCSVQHNALIMQQLQYLCVKLHALHKGKVLIYRYIAVAANTDISPWYITALDVAPGGTAPGVLYPITVPYRVPVHCINNY